MLALHTQRPGRPFFPLSSRSLSSSLSPSPTDSIINPEAPLALRLSGQLLLGVVKIYSRKVRKRGRNAAHGKTRAFLFGRSLSHLHPLSIPSF